MARNNSGDSTHAHSDLDSLVIDGVEYLAYPYSGCPKCSSTEERLPFYEVSMKESLAGKKNKYPMRIDMNLDSCTDISFSCIADQVEYLTDRLMASKDNDCPTQNSDKISVTKPTTYELERIINTIEVYVSSIKARLQKYKGKESHQFRGGTLEPLDAVTEEVREEEPGPENDETVLNDDEMESGGGEITAVMNDSSDATTVVLNDSSNATTVVMRDSSNATAVVMNESSDVGKEMRNKSSVEGKTKHYYKLAKVRRDEAVSGVQETESNESEIESICDENESLDAESFKSSDEELSKVEKNSQHKQGPQTCRREQSPGRGISYVCDNDNSYAELEIHSGVHGSSSIKGRISIRKHHIYDEDKFEDNRSQDTEEPQPLEKRRCLGPEEESPAQHTPSEFDGNYPNTGSQRSVESETTESSLYETAKEMSSQASEGMYDSSGSATP